jgi:hypothetical protein
MTNHLMQEITQAKEKGKRSKQKQMTLVRFPHWVEYFLLLL